MTCLVMKFGGTSVAGVERIGVVSRHVAREVSAGHGVVVVVSAMAGMTDRLAGWMRDIAPDLENASEGDVVLSTGEQVVSGLLAAALERKGIPARSWQGWQVPIVTNDAHGRALVAEIDGSALHESMAKGYVAVVAGFQGVTHSGRIATLGRGGSDTSAVAIAAALQADRCDIYTDVDGVYTADPRIVPRAGRLNCLFYEETMEMAFSGAKILHARSVELAMNYKVPLLVRSSFAKPESQCPAFRGDEREVGTFICREDKRVECRKVSSISYSREEAKIALIGVKNEPDRFVRIFSVLADANVNVDMIVQSASDHGRVDLTFTVSRADFPRAVQLIATLKSEVDYREMATSNKVAKLSAIGVGMQSHSGVACEMFKALAQLGIDVLAVTTSEIKLSVLVEEANIERAVRALHSAYGLDVL